MLNPRHSCMILPHLLGIKRRAPSQCSSSDKGGESVPLASDGLASRAGGRLDQTPTAERVQGQWRLVLDWSLLFLNVLRGFIVIQNSGSAVKTFVAEAPENTQDPRLKCIGLSFKAARGIFKQSRREDIITEWVKRKKYIKGKQDEGNKNTCAYTLWHTQEYHLERITRGLDHSRNSNHIGRRW